MSNTSTEPWDSLQALWSADGHRDPYPYYRALLADSPLIPIGPRRVMALGFAVCDEVLRGTDVFRVCGAEWADHAWEGWRAHPAIGSVFNQLNRQDPPDNQPARRLLSKFFGRRGIGALRPMVEELATRYVERLHVSARGRTGDAVEQLLPLPHAVMANILGIPDADLTRLQEWTSALMEANDFNYPGHGLDKSDYAVAEFRDYVETSCRDSDLYRMLDANWAAEDRADVLDTIMFVAGAGTHTTASMLGTGVTVLAENRSLAQQLGDDSELARPFVDETLRFDPPVQFTARWTGRATELSGRSLPARTMVLVFLGAACRDPEQFEEPDRFHLRRFQTTPPPPTLSFGVGQHFCIGAGLAKLIGEVTFPMLARRCTGLRTAGQVVRTDGLVVHGYERLPVTVPAGTGGAGGDPEPARIDGETLPDALAAVGRRRPDTPLVFPNARTETTAADMVVRVTRVANSLYAAGVRRGDCVALLVPPGPQVFLGLLAITGIGAAVSVMPTRPFADPSVDADHIDTIMTAADIRTLVADPHYDTLVSELRRRNPQLRCLAMTEGPARPLPGSGPNPEDLAVVQFTSGSTAQPKGVTLPHRTVLAGLRSILTSAQVTGSDSLVQWVPHHHDMGLFTPLGYWLAGLPTHTFTPASFIKDPLAFLRYFAAAGATTMTGPDFAYELLTDAVRARPPGDMNLARWRIAYNGAEPVRARTVAEFTSTMRPYGVGESTMYPVYGLAEATLAGAFPEPGSTPRIVHIDRGRLAEDGQAVEVGLESTCASALVSVGAPVDGLRLRLTTEQGGTAVDGQLGEIQLCGPAVTPGYFRSPEHTAETFDGPWLRTGDTGFQFDGNLYVVGRRKDVIVVHGRNFFPEDAEAIASTVPGVRQRRCVAFSEDAEMVIAVESRDGVNAGELTTEIHKQVVRRLGLDRIRVRVVPRGSIPRTTSGKVRRAAARTLLSEETK